GAGEEAWGCAEVRCCFAFPCAPGSLGTHCVTKRHGVDPVVLDGEVDAGVASVEAFASVVFAEVQPSAAGEEHGVQGWCCACVTLHGVPLKDIGGLAFVHPGSRPPYCRCLAAATRPLGSGS